MLDTAMRAARYYRYGPPETLVVETVPRPHPGEGEVLVRVHAAGVNPWDWKVRKGLLQSSMPLSLPQTPGIDLAGVVDEVGPGVEDLRPGQAVYGFGSGTSAEYATAKATELAPKPARLSFDQAAAVPTGARTAWSALFASADLRAAQTLLVHGAAGGVGLYAVQFGRWKGARVIGTASARNVEFVRSLGAETAIDYAAAPFETLARDVDVVFDTVGGEVQRRSFGVLRPGGILVTIVGRPDQGIAQQHGVRAAGAPRLAGGPVLREIGALIDSGDVAPVVQRVLLLEQIAEAHALSESGHGRGRIVLHVQD